MAIETLDINVLADGNCLYNAIALGMIQGVLTEDIASGSPAYRAIEKHFLPKLLQKAQDEGLSVSFEKKDRLPQKLLKVLQHYSPSSEKLGTEKLLKQLNWSGVQMLFAAALRSLMADALAENLGNVREDARLKNGLHFEYAHYCAFRLGYAEQQYSPLDTFEGLRGQYDPVFKSHFDGEREALVRHIETARAAQAKKADNEGSSDEDKATSVGDAAYTSIRSYVEKNSSINGWWKQKNDGGYALWCRHAAIPTIFGGEPEAKALATRLRLNIVQLATNDNSESSYAKPPKTFLARLATLRIRHDANGRHFHAKLQNNAIGQAIKEGVDNSPLPSLGQRRRGSISREANKTKRPSKKHSKQSITKGLSIVATLLLGVVLLATGIIMALGITGIIPVVGGSLLAFTADVAMKLAISPFTANALLGGVSIVLGLASLVGSAFIYKSTKDESGAKPADSAQPLLPKGPSAAGSRVGSSLASQPQPLPPFGTRQDRVVRLPTARARPPIPTFKV